MTRSLRPALLGLACLAALALAGDPRAEERRFQVHGYVQWVAGTTMQLALDDGASVSIDLSSVNQAAYQALQAGDGVTVAGVIDGRDARWIADAVEPDSD